MSREEGNRTLRHKERKVYSDDIDEDELESGNKRLFSVPEKLTCSTFDRDDLLLHMKGEDITMKFLQENGLISPILVEEKSGLGMRIPGENFTVNDVRMCVGSRRVLDVMDVQSQKALQMTMKEWAEYYLSEEKDRLLNVISLEFSHTRLENYVEQPVVVQQLDWINTVWPSYLKDAQVETTNILEQMKYPKVQKYCLMSVGGCYTDFHIDMGGTSVWYHILKGAKVFWLIPPTEENLDLFEKWVKSGRQGDTFFGDKVKNCNRINLKKGNTFFIPTGWIHAVYTPEDSLVFGGNFLHSFGIEMQLRIWEIESRTHVPSSFRYPFFTELQWYVVDQYLSCVRGKSYRVRTADEIKTEKDEKNDLLLESGTMCKNDVKCSCGRSTCKLCKMSGKSSSAGIQRPRRSISSSGLNGIDQIRPVSVKLENCMLMDQKKLVEDSKKAVKKPQVNFTKREWKGLCLLVEWLKQLPPTKKLVPKDILEPDELLADMKKLLDDHCGDDAAEACTGVSVIKWPAKKNAKVKPRSYTTNFSRPKAVKRPKAQVNSGIRRRRVRCKRCEPCTRNDCRLCSFCIDMKKYGGPGTCKQSCISRQCISPQLPITADCMVCRIQRTPDDQADNTIMECGICWEIIHPQCFKKKHSTIQSEGIVNDDLDNSWECPKCVEEGKTGQLYVRVRPKCKLPEGVEPSINTSSDLPREPRDEGDEEGEEKEVLIDVESSPSTPMDRETGSSLEAKDVELEPLILADIEADPLHQPDPEEAPPVFRETVDGPKPVAIGGTLSNVAIEIKPIPTSPVPSLQDSDIENHKVSPASTSSEASLDKTQDSLKRKNKPSRAIMKGTQSLKSPFRSIDMSLKSPPRKVLRVELSPLKDYPSPRIGFVSSRSPRQRQPLPVLSLLRSPTSASNHKSVEISVNSRGREINLPSRFT